MFFIHDIFCTSQMDARIGEHMVLDHVIIDKMSQPGNHSDIAPLTHLDSKAFKWGFPGFEHTGAPLDGLKVDFYTVLDVRR